MAINYMMIYRVLRNRFWLLLLLFASCTSKNNNQIKFAKQIFESDSVTIKVLQKENGQDEIVINRLGKSSIIKGLKSKNNFIERINNDTIEVIRYYYVEIVTKNYTHNEKIEKVQFRAGKFFVRQTPKLITGSMNVGLMTCDSVKHYKEKRILYNGIKSDTVNNKDLCYDGFQFYKVVLQDSVLEFENYIILDSSVILQYKRL